MNRILLGFFLVWLLCGMVFAVNPPDSLSLDVGDLDGNGSNDVLVLEKRSMRSPTFVLKTWTEAGGYQNITPPPVRTYRGYVQGNSGLRVNGSISVDGTSFSGNLSDGRAINRRIVDMPVTYTEPAGTFDPGTGNIEIPLTIDRSSPTPLGDIVPKTVMRKIIVGVDGFDEWIGTLGLSIDEAVYIAEQRFNDSDFIYARDMGIAWEISIIVLRLDPYPEILNYKDAWRDEIIPTLQENPDAVIRFIGPGGGWTGGQILNPDDPGAAVFSTIGDDRGISSAAIGHEVGHNFTAGHSFSWNDIMDRSNGCLGTGNVERMIERVHGYATEENCPAVTYGSPLPPMAREDAVTTSVDTPIDIDVLDNDYDGNGDAITVSYVGPVTTKGGVAEILGNNQIRYTPPPNWVGQDFFYYHVTDATGISNTRGYVVVYVCNDGLVTHLTFDEQAGFTAHDIGPYQSHGYILSGNSLDISVPGKYGDGIVDNTDLYLFDTGDPVDQSFSVSLWVKYNELPTADGALVKKRRYRKDSEDGFGAGWMIGHMTVAGAGFTFNGALQRSLLSDPLFDRTSTTPIEVGQWYHLVMVLDRTNDVIRAWVNNQEVANSRQGTYVPDGVIAKSHTPVQLMTNSSGSYVMDDFRIYNKALTVPEIADLYTGADTVPAGAPTPKNSARNAQTDQKLSWMPGRDETYTYNVYVGTDYNAVFNADIGSPEYKGSYAQNEYQGSFDPDTVYYWRIDPINGPVVISGDVWWFYTGGSQPASPQITNPSFESPVVQPYSSRPVVNNWYGEGKTVWEGDADVPNTPYGDNWVEPDYIFQKIGTWHSGYGLEIGLLLGAGNLAGAFPGITVSLHVGEGKEYVTGGMDLGGSTHLFDRTIATMNLSPALSSLQTSEQMIALPMGVGLQEGDVLWLRIVSNDPNADGVFVDNVSVSDIAPTYYTWGGAGSEASPQAWNSEYNALPDYWNNPVAPLLNGIDMITIPSGGVTLSDLDIDGTTVLSVTGGYLEGYGLNVGFVTPGATVNIDGGKINARFVGVSSGSTMKILSGQLNLRGGGEPIATATTGYVNFAGNAGSLTAPEKDQAYLESKILAGTVRIDGVQLSTVDQIVNGRGFDVSGTTIILTVDTIPPAAPTGLAATAGNASVTLDWDDNVEPDLLGYTVYRSTTSGSGYMPIATRVISSDYVDNTVVNGMTYYYVVVATDNGVKESGYSNEASATPVFQIINPSFEDPILASGMNVAGINSWYDSVSYTFTSDDGAATHPETPYGDNWAEFAQKRWMYAQIGTYTGSMNYEIRFLMGARSDKDPSPTAVVLFVGGDPAFAADLNVQFLITELGDTVNPLVGTVGASLVQLSDVIAPFSGIGLATSEQSVELSIGSGHTIGDPLWVMFYCPLTSGGRMLIDNVNIVEAVVDTTPPAAPTGLTATPSDGSVSLDWTDNTESDMASYNVYRDTVAGLPYTQVATDVTSSDYVDNTVTNGTTYYYVATAVDTGSNESGNSNEASATPQATPDTDPPTPNPATFAVVPVADSDTAISMTATTGTDASGPVEYLFTETSGNPGGTSSAWQTSISYTDSGLTASTQYTYTVTMRDSLANTGTASSPASATTDAAPAVPAAPSSLSATAVSTTEIDLSWTDNASDETGFKVERSKRVNTAFVEIATIGADVTSFSDTGLKKGTMYYYRVRATNANGDSAYSNEASAKTPK